MFSRRSFLAWLPAFLGGAAAVPILTDWPAPPGRVVVTQSTPERKTRLLKRLAKVFAILADASYAIADGNLDEAEELLNDLSVSESFVTVGPCVVRRATDAEVAGWRAERDKQRSGAK